MPAAAERALRAKAEEKGLTGKRKAAYIYGGLRAIGWKPRRERGHAAKELHASA